QRSRASYPPSGSELAASPGTTAPELLRAVRQTKRPDTASAMAGRLIERTTCLPIRERLLEVVRDQLGHLEHRNLPLAAKYLPELLVCIDQTLVDRVLQLVLLDVVPNLLGDFGARQRHAAHDCCEHRGRHHGLHERGIRFALRRRFLLLRGGLPRGGLLRRLLGRLLGLLGRLLALLCSSLGGCHSSPSWWLIARTRRRWTWSQIDLLSPILRLHWDKYTAFSRARCANSARSLGCWTQGVASGRIRA